MEENKSEYLYVYLSDVEESEKLGMSLQTIKKYHKSLMEKGILEILEINGNKVKRFNLGK